MFMFPEPPPIDYVLEEVSPSFLSDGIFLHGKPGPSHKCVAKQLRPIKRRISDPVAPQSELDPRSLDSSAEKQRSWYAESRDAFLIYELVSRLNQQTFVHKKRRDGFSIFPRSRQYEYEYIQRRRLENIPKENFVDVSRCRAKEEKNETIRTDDEPCYILKPPFWWKDESKKKVKLPIGSIDDYAFNRLEYVEDDKRRSERSMTTDRAFKQVDDEIQAPEIIKKTNDAADIVKSEKKIPKIDCCLCSPIKDGAARRTDVRWQPIYNMAGFSGTDAERKEELRMVTKPYLHELQTWYSKNLPTKLLLPVRWEGKRPIPEWRFSHL
ncbi:hypothetical protein KPH14_002368 [Odynerus spinipes]|uniref:Uncharacterized protein n=1 Tax=Odynerus spinipes TaxID=1348599 RepID=A0AAD9VQ23_9HYME|nr:hypothetical protein KPH14_002368 [Odynerus spinipes]